MANAKVGGYVVARIAALRPRCVAVGCGDEHNLDSEKRDTSVSTAEKLKEKS